MLTGNYTFNLDAALRTRVQQPGEGFRPFCRSVWRQFIDINPSMSETEIVNIILKNYKPDNVASMKFKGQIQTVNDLIHIGKDGVVTLMDADKYRTLLTRTKQNVATTHNTQQKLGGPNSAPDKNMVPPRAPDAKPDERGQRSHRGCWSCGSVYHV
jgi:hypothetical protein